MAKGGDMGYKNVEKVNGEWSSSGIQKQLNVFMYELMIHGFTQHALLHSKETVTGSAWAMEYPKWEEEVSLDLSYLLCFFLGTCCCQKRMSGLEHLCSDPVYKCTASACLYVIFPQLILSGQSWTWLLSKSGFFHAHTSAWEDDKIICQSPVVFVRWSCLLSSFSPLIFPNSLLQLEEWILGKHLLIGRKKECMLL